MPGTVGHYVQSWCGRPERRHWIGSLLTASAVHVALVTVLCFLVLEPPTGVLERRVDSEWCDGPEEVEFVEPVQVMQAATNPHAGGRAADSLRVLHEASEAPRAADVLWRTPVGRRPVMTGELSGSDLLAPVAPRAGESEPGAGEGTGTGAGTGNGDESGFFGLNSPGRRFVFVVDASSSMQKKHDSEAKTRFGRVKLEIVRSIAGMTPQQGFFVIYFNSVPHPMPANGLQPATPAVQRHYLDWTTRFRAGGDTNPLQALELALALQPDVIYFLTDGVIPRGKNVLRRVTGLNQGRTRVHTFAFGSRSGEEMMQALAEQNRGEYRFVP